MSSSPLVRWGGTSRPSDGLKTAMERIARDFAAAGEYAEVKILYDYYFLPV